MQLSPDTRRNNWDACAGYHYSDSVIYGFSHLHLSGTGAIDLGDILFHPTTAPLRLQPAGYIFEPLLFSHDDEEATPGYYKVRFKEKDIVAELSATTRVGAHRYTFPASDEAKIVIDLHHGLSDEVIHHLELHVIAENEISGARVTSGWTPNQHIYFVARFSRPFDGVQLISDGVVIDEASSITGDNIQGVIEYQTRAGEQIEVLVGLSVVSIDNARMNLDAEAPQFDFDGIRQCARQTWADALDVIRIKGATPAQKRTFYTAMYRSMVVPNVISDVDGSYRGHDMQIAKLPGNRKMYSTLSLWDTFRTWHPLKTLINDSLVTDIIHSMLAMYDATGELPIWPLVSGETGTMIGYHSVSVIADAYLKGIRDFDVEHAFEAMKVSSNSERKGGRYYTELGYIPADRAKESISCLLEYAYDDWCIAQMAEALGRHEDHRIYSERARSWMRVFDGSTGFFRGKKADGNWVSPFEPTVVSRDYTEANAWQYRFFVPHDIQGLISMLGGEQQFLEALDGLFDETTEVYSEIPDVTGLIGQYAHGNEPSHHKAYLYSYAGQAWKTQAMIRRILEEMYSDQPDGIVGNEDCGQMSAWYIMSSLGFYPVAPGSGEYVLTSPLFKRADMRLHNGKTLTVKANNPAKNVYISRVMFNGKQIDKTFITHDQIMEGGTLEFVLTSTPEKNRMTTPDVVPYSMTTENMVSVPYIKQDVHLFVDEIEIELGCVTPGAFILFTLDGSDPDGQSQVYESPVRVERDLLIKAQAFKEGYLPSPLLEVKATKAVFKDPDRHAASRNGVRFRYFEGQYQSVYDMFATPVIEEGIIESPRIDLAKKEDHFGFEFTGLIFAPYDGIYDFYTESDDGSMLYIGNQAVVYNDGSHSAIRTTGRIALKKGFHKFRLLYFEDYAGEYLQWGWKLPGSDRLTRMEASYLYLNQ